jgi:hypothetical protein
VFDFNISLGIGGWALVIGAALLFGIVLQFIGEVRFPYEWVVTAIAALMGAVVVSEFFVDLRGFAPVWDGLAIVPAAIGGVIVGVVVAVIARYSTGGSFVHLPASA